MAVLCARLCAVLCAPLLPGLPEEQKRSDSTRKPSSSFPSAANKFINVNNA